MKKENHTSHFAPRTSQRGITLIALIITIIVMLILVGVTINVALNGGLFSKAEEATTKTKIAQIQEALTIKKAEVLSENDGKAPEDYGITIDKLNLPEQLETEYENKLIISKDAKLYYDASVVTNTEEQNLFESMGIQPYVETPVPPRVPFTNYIENGNNYYIKGDKTSDSYEVMVFSKEPLTMKVYYIRDEQVSGPDSISFELIDKNKIKDKVGYTNEMIEQAIGITIEEVCDDAIYYKTLDGQKVVNPFKSNYTQMFFGDGWVSLDTTYTLPTANGDGE